MNGWVFLLKIILLNLPELSIGTILIGNFYKVKAKKAGTPAFFTNLILSPFCIP
jgi:hypothetical protein